MAHHDFATPVTEAQIRALAVDDTVTLNGTLYGIRDATQIALFDRGRTTRFDLTGHAVIHTAPNVKKVDVSARILWATRPCASERRPAFGWSASRDR
jgi:L(+)-tartrate dehydratase beta subunit